MGVLQSKVWPKMTSREEFRFLADLVFKRSRGDDTGVRGVREAQGIFEHNRFHRRIDARDIESRRSHCSAVSRRSGIFAAPSTAPVSCASYKQTRNGFSRSLSASRICQRSNRAMPDRESSGCRSRIIIRSFLRSCDQHRTVRP